MNKDEIEQLLIEDPDFIALKRFDYSIKNLLTRYADDGAPDHVAAAALLLTEEEFVEQYNKVVLKLKELIGKIED